MHGIIGRRMYETWYQGTALIRDRGLTFAVITHELPLDRFGRGFRGDEAGTAGKSSYP